jgi:hypothetical protein
LGITPLYDPDLDITIYVNSYVQEEIRRVTNYYNLVIYQLLKQLGGKAGINLFDLMDEDKKVLVSSVDFDNTITLKIGD